jgi:hypothetical protein
MRLVHTRYLITAGNYDQTPFWRGAVADVAESIKRVTWPEGNKAGEFAIYPQSGKKSGEGSGVVPIKKAFLETLASKDWQVADRKNPELFDAVKFAPGKNYVAVEWETGNISSSHRSLNRFLRARIAGDCMGGILVLPTAELAQYLTDRVGNWEELEPYFPVIERYQWDRGALAVVAIEHDRVDLKVPRIRKGTDGRARV